MAGTDLWRRTMQQHGVYLNAGWKVMYIWGHEYLTTCGSFPRSLRGVIREHRTMGRRPSEGERD